MPQVYILKNWSIPQPQALSDKTKTVQCYSFGKTQIEHLAVYYSQFRENCFSPKKMSQRTAHLVSYTSFTRDVDQYPNTSTFINTFFTTHLSLATFVGVRKIAPEENCPPVRVRFWFRISVRIRTRGQFSWGQFFQIHFLPLNIAKFLKTAQNTSRSSRLQTLLILTKFRKLHRKALLLESLVLELKNLQAEGLELY